MKIAELDNSVERSGFDNEKSFSIKATPKMFRMLSSGIYSNKIGAVIRELSCNAYDAHVSAKKSHIPFEIHLPTNLEPWFSVKDNGIGLSHEDVTNLYCNYGESTKENSNDFIGAFGLGSKSPFSYVDTFTVTSIFNGKKRSYTAFISENGEPKISMFHEGDTDLENGIEVQVPVKDNDFSSFRDNAKTFLRYFNPLPKINVPNFDFDLQLPILEGMGWRYFGCERYSNTFKLIQGHVSYPLDKDSFGSQSMPAYIKEMVKEFKMEIDFDIGLLEVAASREALSYNKATVKNIIDRLEQVYIQIKMGFDKHVKNIAGDTEWERNLNLRDFKYHNSGLFDIFDKEKKLIRDFKLHFDVFKNTSVNHKSSSYRDNNFTLLSKDRGDDLLSLNPSLSQHYFLFDMERPKTWFKHYLNTLGKSYRDSIIIVINPVGANGTDSIQDILDSLGNPKIKKVSELVRPPRQERGARDTSLRFIPIPDVTFTTYWSGSSWSGGDDDLPEEGLYLEIDRNNVYYKDARMNNYNDVIREARKLGFFDNTKYTKIHVLKKSQMKLVKNNPDWKNAIDFIKESIDGWFDTNKIEYAKYIDFNKNKFGSNAEYAYKVLKSHPDFKNLKKSSIGKMLELYDQYANIKVGLDIFGIIRMTNHIVPTHDVKIEHLSDLYVEIEEKYPLFKMAMGEWKNSEKATAHVIEYILMTDEKKKSLTTVA